jgi:uncharacterized lipoprotein YmbA
MIRSLAALALGCCLSGCIVFDRRSEAVTFHQFSAPTAAANRTAPLVFIPRTVVPAGLRRANIVLVDDAGRARLDDNHRWLAPLDRAVSETVGRHLTRLTGLPATAQAPAGEHMVLFLTLDKMELAPPAETEKSIFSLPGATRLADAVMQVTARWEKADGTTLSVRVHARRRLLKDPAADAFVRAQSDNLGEIAAEIAAALPPLSP